MPLGKQPCFYHSTAEQNYVEMAIIGQDFMKPCSHDAARPFKQLQKKVSWVNQRARYAVSCIIAPRAERMLLSVGLSKPNGVEAYIKCIRLMIEFLQTFFAVLLRSSVERARIF